MAIRINFVTQFDNRALRRAQREIKAIGQSISRSLDVAVAGAVIGATVGITNAVKAASNLAAEYEGVNQIFGQAAKGVQEFAKQASKTAGLSETEALQGAKTFGLFAQAAGLSTASAATFSTTLVQLAGDLGSFNDVPTADALAAIQSGLQGQAEPLRKFGVFLTDDALKAEALAMSIYNGTGALSAQQKMLASYSLILKSTNVQQGDFIKYADTFGNSTKTITKDLENLSAQIGQQLLPVIEEMLPAISELIPILGEKLQKAVDSIDFEALFTAMVNGLTFLIENGDKIAAIVLTFYALSKAIMAIEIAIKLATVATGIFTGTLAINPVVAITVAVLALAAGFALLADDARKANAELYKNTGLNATQIRGRVFAAPGGALGKDKNKGQAGSVLDSYFGSTGLVGGLGEAAKAAKAAEVIIPTITGLTAAQKKSAAASKAAAAASKKAAEAAAKVAKETAEALKAEQEALAEFSLELKNLALNTKPLVEIGREIGQFEQTTVDSFDAITDSIKAGIANKTIIDRAGQNLLDYVATERKALAAIAQQRDELAKKRSLVESLIGDVKASVVGFGNITEMLEKQTTQVEKTVTRMVGGISLATKTTIEEVVSGNGLVGNLSNVVAKTKMFALQLKELRTLGLDQNLYKQIVDAGIEAGSATAAEIIKGGAGTINELNSLFRELEIVGEAIAEDTALVMYNNGVEVAGGLVAGLMSQEQALVNAAIALADAFRSTFDSMVSDLKTPSQEMKTLTLSITDILAGNTGIEGAGSNITRSLASQYLFNQQVLGGQGPKTITINVNAGIGTNGKAVGQAIQSELNKYLKSSVVLQ